MKNAGCKDARMQGCKRQKVVIEYPFRLALSGFGRGFGSHRGLGLVAPPENDSSGRGGTLFQKHFTQPEETISE
jgi:hypothetical protein